MINYGHTTWGRPPKTRFRAHLGLCGPPEAAGCQTRQTRVGIKLKKNVFFVLLYRVPSATGTRNILCCRRGCGSAVVSPLVMNRGHITWGTSPKARFRAHLGLCGPLEASVGQTRQTRVGTVFEPRKKVYTYGERINQPVPVKDEYLRL